MVPPPTILVSGAMANKHLNGGEAWVRLNWVIGLRKLGCQVYFVEQIRSDTCVDDDGAPTAFEQSANLRYFDHVVRWFGMEQTASLICDEGRQVHGLGYQDLLKAASRADLLVNVSGHLRLATILSRVRLKVYIDVDPGFTQFWHAQGIGGAAVEGHDAYLTIGENVGTPACSIPTNGIAWQAQRPFVVLDQWPVCRDGDPNRFTTVGAWRGPFGPVEHEGRRFGLKVHEFRRLITLPRRAPQTFEIALSIDPADRADLEGLHSHGWHLVNPREVAGDPLAFRRYVHGSGGEFSAAQGIYVDTQCGWVSDRTVHYLASGKPALVQDTGFSRNYPVGDGLVPFRTLDEAVAGSERIAHEYEHHSRAARRLAEAYFDSDKVLREVMRRIGMRLPGHNSGN